jgi:hypothetical protein
MTDPTVSTSTTVSAPVVCDALPDEPAMKRRGSPLLVAAYGQWGHLSRPAARWGRGFPGSAPTTPCSTTHRTPVPTPALAHLSPRAIRVRRSPR